MPWPFEEKQSKGRPKPVLTAARLAIGGAKPLSARCTWGAWTSVQDGERAVASAVWRRRDSAPHLPEIRRHRVSGAFAALVWAAMHAAALLALPPAMWTGRAP